MRSQFMYVNPQRSLQGATNNLLVPDDYDDLLSYYTKRGYRVIAMAGKSIDGLSWLKAQKMKRCASIIVYRSHLC